MPIQFEIVDSTYIILRGEGLITGAEILEANARLYSEPEFKNVAQFQLWDLTALKKFTMSGQEHQEAARQDREALSVYSHIAVAIAGTADHVYGISRMYAGYVPDGVSNMVFRSRSDAEAWILRQIEKKFHSRNDEAVDKVAPPGQTQSPAPTDRLHPTHEETPG